MQLPLELIERTLLYIDFEKVIMISDYAAKRLYNPNVQTCDWLAKNNNLDVFRWFRKINPNLNLYHQRVECIIMAVRHNNLEALKLFYINIERWSDENDIDLDNIHSAGYESIINAAAEGNSLEIIKWFHDNHFYGFTKNAISMAAKNGHLEMVKWIYINRGEGFSHRAIDMAAKNGHLEVVKWLCKKSKRDDVLYYLNRAIKGAIKNGHLHIVKWLYEHYLV